MDSYLGPSGGLHSSFQTHSYHYILEQREREMCRDVVVLCVCVCVCVCVCATLRIHTTDRGAADSSAMCPPGLGQSGPDQSQIRARSEPDQRQLKVRRGPESTH